MDLYTRTILLAWPVGEAAPWILIVKDEQELRTAGSEEKKDGIEDALWDKARRVVHIDR